MLAGRSVTRQLAMVGLSALVLVACGDSTPERRRAAALTEGCLLNSDCKSPFVCAFERCHEACAETRDCPGAQRCVAGEGEFHVCLLPDETQCTTDSGCQGEQVCAADHECRDLCESSKDCIDGQSCASSGACAEPGEVDEDGALIVRLTSAGASGSSASGAGGSSSGGSAAGGSGNSGGSSPVGGSSGSAGNAGSSGSGGVAGSAGSAGAGGTEGSGGSQAAGGKGGVAGSGAASSAGGAGGSAGGTDGGSGGNGGSDCPTGKAECDDDPDTVCETDVTLVTRCGDCDTSCNSANGAVECQAGQCVITDCDVGYEDCDDDPANGCEVSLVSNDEHCGVCGRDCSALGTTCSVDACASVLLHGELPIGSGNSGALTWAFDDGTIFHAGYNSYTILSIATESSDYHQLWASTTTAGRYSLVAEKGYLYWAHRGDTNYVLRKAYDAPEQALPEIAFQPLYQPYFLTVHGGAFYWLSGDYQSGDPAGYVYTRGFNAAASDPGVRIVSEDQGLHGAVTWFAASDDALYWYTTADSAYELRTVPLAGGTPTVVPTGPIATTNGYDSVVVRTMGSTIYYNQEVGTATSNGIYSWTPGDSTPTQLVEAEDVVDLLLDDEFIYYLSRSASTLMRAPLEGGGGEPLSGSLSVNAAAVLLGQDDASVYVALPGSSTTNIHQVFK